MLEQYNKSSENKTKFPFLSSAIDAALIVPPLTHGTNDCAPLSITPIGIYKEPLTIKSEPMQETIKKSKSLILSSGV